MLKVLGWRLNRKRSAAWKLFRKRLAAEELGIGFSRQRWGVHDLVRELFFRGQKVRKLGGMFEYLRDCQVDRSIWTADWMAQWNRRSGRRRWVDFLLLHPGSRLVSATPLSTTRGWERLMLSRTCEDRTPALCLWKQTTAQGLLLYLDWMLVPPTQPGRNRFWIWEEGVLHRSVRTSLGSCSHRGGLCGSVDLFLCFLADPICLYLQQGSCGENTF